jgi:hypothetical protein
MTNRSRTYLLIEERLGTPLDRLVMKARGTEPRPKTSWSQIALLLHQKTGVYVSNETLRIWFIELEARRLAKSTTSAA